MHDATRAPRPVQRFLILARDLDDLELLPRALSGAAPILVRATRRVGEAVALLAREPFDIVVCPVEDPRDVLSLIRLKKASPRTPVLALAPEEACDIAEMSLLMGAAAVFARGDGPAATADVLRQALEAPGFPRRGAASTEWLRLVQDVRDPSARLRMLAAEALSGVLGHRAEGFDPLLVEDSPDEAALFIHALRKEGLRRRMPVVRSAREAIEYLSGAGPYADRSRHPVPSIVILDFHLGAESGEGVLRFIRSEPSLRRLPVVLLSSTRNSTDVARMVDLGISTHVVKPLGLGELQSAVGLILDFWQLWRAQSAEPAAIAAQPALGG
jgi:CheY-like chemotaxis protein